MVHAGRFAVSCLPVAWWLRANESVVMLGVLL